MDNEKQTVSTAQMQEVSNLNAETESIYEVEYLAQNHKALGASYAVVATALKLAGKEKATLREAQKIVDRFKKKEVK